MYLPVALTEIDDKDDVDTVVNSMRTLLSRTRALRRLSLILHLTLVSVHLILNKRTSLIITIISTTIVLSEYNTFSDICCSAGLRHAEALDAAQYTKGSNFDGNPMTMPLQSGTCVHHRRPLRLVLSGRHPDPSHNDPGIVLASNLHIAQSD
ncbi:hypothetical protein B0H11DRAFT_2111641 [Mycena galericulata]|nr:hypothetical protein B0H11DRAFT_2111641 [Mycena galericulata]